MGFLDRFKRKQQENEASDRAEYARLIALEAAGKLQSKDDARLEALIRKFSLSEDDVKGHLNALVRASALSDQIEAGKQAATEFKRVTEEVEAHNAAWKKIVDEWEPKGRALNERYIELERKSNATYAQELQLEDLRDANRLAFGLPPQAPPQRQPEKPVEQLRQEQHDLADRSTAQSLQAAIVGGYRLNPSKSDLEILERAEAQGWIQKGIAAKAAKLVKSSPEDDKPKAEKDPFRDHQHAESDNAH